MAALEHSQRELHVEVELVLPQNSRNYSFSLSFFATVGVEDLRILWMLSSPLSFENTVLEQLNAQLSFFRRDIHQPTDQPHRFEFLDDLGEELDSILHDLAEEDMGVLIDHLHDLLVLDLLEIVDGGAEVLLVDVV